MSILNKKEINKIKTAIPDYQCFIVGSRTIKNVVSGDVDILVLIDKYITKKELNDMRDKFYGICPQSKYSLIFNWAKDNKRIKELFPYYDLKTDDYKYEDKDKLTTEEYNVLKMRLFITRFKSKRFYKERQNNG